MRICAFENLIKREPNY